MQALTGASLSRTFVATVGALEPIGATSSAATGHWTDGAIQRLVLTVGSRLRVQEFGTRPLSRMKHRWKPTQQKDNERKVDTTEPKKKLSELEDEMARLRQQPDVLRYHVLEDAARDLQLSPLEPASIIE